MKLQFDNLIARNSAMTTLPALHANDYDFYLESVLKADSLHIGSIYYRGREVRRINNARK